MKTLQEFAQFVGKPNNPISPRALVAYLKLGINSNPLSLRELTSVFDDALAPASIESVSVAPTSGTVPFKVGMQVTGTKGFFMEISWRILRNGQQVATYPNVLGQVAHVFSEPGTYNAEATFKGIGSTGYAEVSKSVAVVAQPQPAPPQPTPTPTPIPPPAKPSISVNYDGPAAEASFTVTGSGFVPNHAVHIRVVNNFTLQNGFFDTSSNASGAIDHEINIPSIPGIKLSFSANDERSDPSDLTGTLWSNTVTLTVT
ncbi:hypothetical protein IQ254_18580 [Nodosilinea sp. LEGE 07088]|uniref:hypothetical protein n=1 Tax=Nodosilinea sp. LEGE 07088 TaxID=2777968 RepID=UPI00188026BA|nr:hypothetical protein [Nodosilinea sp. LEGE 07088]MBE9139177.1 hypothetical protein [Nodosilinea sp. LEGE 07088]